MRDSFCRKLFLAASVAVTAAAIAGCTRLRIEPSASAEGALPYRTWSMYEGDLGAAHFSSLTQIHRGNVHALKVAWTYTVADNSAMGFCPLVVDSTMYVIGEQGALVALHAATGKELWVHTFPNPSRSARDRGLLYWESTDRADRRLFVPRRNQLYAIDALTGQDVTGFGTNGSIDVREGIARDREKISANPSSPGIVFEDLVILGSGPGEAYGSGPGDIRAFDARTGRLVWIFHTIPHPGEFGHETWDDPEAWKSAGGANVWGGMSVDAARGILYLPLGSATYDFYGADRLGANLFANALVALDVRTGRRLWHFQTVHHDLWDYDLASTPALLTVRHDGKPRDIVALAGKTGFVYTFDRVTGEPIWPIEERPVPPSDMPGEVTWPTQSFPTKPEPFAVLSFTPEDVNPYLPAAERDSLIRYVAGMNNRGLFTPPSTTPTMQMPGNSGGSNWGTTAADPTTGLFYVIAKNLPTVLTLEREIPGVPGPEAFPPERGAFVYRQNCQQCHLADRIGQLPVPTLVGVTERLTPEEFRTVVTEGRGTMPAFRDLSAAEVGFLLAFLTNPDMIPPRPPVEIDSTVPAPVRYKTGYGYFAASIGWAIKPPWTTMTAYDMNTGEKKWQIPVGEDDTLAVRGIRNTGAVQFRGGPTVTAGGLVFVATDKVFRAYDKETGEEVWSTELPTRVQGIPAVYEVGGRPYIAVGAGARGAGGMLQMFGGPVTGPPRAYVVFSLPAPR
jgi:quinoprotein glucose dehydrogenase